MESITLQRLELELANYKKLDLQKKMDIAVNIHDRIDETSFAFDSDATNLEKVSTLTGVNTTILQEISELEEVSRKFSEWTKEMNVHGGMNIFYATMKKYLQGSYTTDTKIATKSALASMFRNKYKEDFQVHFNKFFTTIPLPGRKQSIIVEKPEIVLRRHNYLQKKMELVEAGKIFVYIEDVCVYIKNRSLKITRPPNIRVKRMLLAVSPELGYVDAVYCAHTTEISLRYWLEEKVTPKLPPGCVIVYEDQVFEDVFGPPKSHSSKKDMIQWLKQNDIPHDPQLHRAELYSLVEKYAKIYGKITKAEQILKQKGHVVLCREEGVDFEYCEPFWKLLKEILESRRGLAIVPKRGNMYDMPLLVKRITTQIQNEYWYELGRKLIDVEINCKKKDEEMEDVFENLMIFATCKQFNPKESEFDEYCEALHHEYIFS